MEFHISWRHCVQHYVAHCFPMKVDCERLAPISEAPVGHRLVMRLRFRGACWDEGEAPAPSYPLVPDVGSCVGKKSFPPPSGIQVFRAEGELAKAPSQVHLPRPRQSSELRSWPCTQAYKRSCGIRENQKMADKSDVGYREHSVKIGGLQGQKVWANEFKRIDWDIIFSSSTCFWFGFQHV